MNVVILFHNGERIEDTQNTIKKIFFTEKNFKFPEQTWKIFKKHGIIRTEVCTFLLQDDRYFANLRKDQAAILEIINRAQWKKAPFFSGNGTD